MKKTRLISLLLSATLALTSVPLMAMPVAGLITENTLEKGDVVSVSNKYNANDWSAGSGTVSQGSAYVITPDGKQGTDRYGDGTNRYLKHTGTHTNLNGFVYVDPDTKLAAGNYTVKVKIKHNFPSAKLTYAVDDGFIGLRFGLFTGTYVDNNKTEDTSDDVVKEAYAEFNSVDEENNVALANTTAGAWSEVTVPDTFEVSSEVSQLKFRLGINYGKTGLQQTYTTYQIDDIVIYKTEEGNKDTEVYRIDFSDYEVGLLANTNTAFADGWYCFGKNSTTSVAEESLADVEYISFGSSENGYLYTALANYTVPAGKYRLSGEWRTASASGVNTKAVLDGDYDYEVSGTVSNEWTSFNQIIDVNDTTTLSGIKFSAGDAFDIKNVKLECLYQYGTAVNTPEVEDNLIPNGRFNDDLDTDVWDSVVCTVSHNGGSPDIESTVSRSMEDGDGYLLATERNHGDSPVVYDNADIKLLAGHKYVFTVDLQSEVPGTTSIIRIFEKNGIVTENSGKIWHDSIGDDGNKVKTVTWEFTPQTNIDSFKINFNGDGGIKAFRIDNMCLRDLTVVGEDDVEGNLVTNGNFTGFSEGDEGNAKLLADAGWSASTTIDLKTDNGNGYLYAESVAAGTDYVQYYYKGTLEADKVYEFTAKLSSDIDGEVSTVRLFDANSQPVANENAEMPEGNEHRVTVTSAGTTIKVTIAPEEDMEGFTLRFHGNDGTPTGFKALRIDDVCLLDVTPEEANDGLNAGILMVLLAKKKAALKAAEEAQGSSETVWEPTNLIPDAMKDVGSDKWTIKDQTLEVKTEGGESYFAMSNITLNHQGFIYKNGVTLKAGTYVLMGDIRTSVKGETSIIRAFLNDVKTGTVNITNDWQSFAHTVTIAADGELKLKICGEGNSKWIQSYDVKNLKLIDAAEVAPDASKDGNLIVDGGFDGLSDIIKGKWSGVKTISVNGSNVTAVDTNKNNATVNKDADGNSYVTLKNSGFWGGGGSLYRTGVQVEAGKAYKFSMQYRNAKDAEIQYLGNNVRVMIYVLDSNGNNLIGAVSNVNRFDNKDIYAKSYSAGWNDFTVEKLVPSASGELAIHIWGGDLDNYTASAKTAVVPTDVDNLSLTELG